MAVDAAGDGDQSTLLRERDARLVASVDQAEGRQKQEINDARVVRILAAEQARQQLGELGPDTGKRGDGGKQGIEKRWPHDDWQNAPRISALARLTTKIDGAIEAHQQEGVSI